MFSPSIISGYYSSYSLGLGSLPDTCAGAFWQRGRLWPLLTCPGITPSLQFFLSSPANPPGWARNGLLQKISSCTIQTPALSYNFPSVQPSPRVSLAEGAEFSLVVPVSHHETCTCPDTKEEPCAMGTPAVPHTVLLCSASGTAMPSAPSGMSLKAALLGSHRLRSLPPRNCCTAHSSQRATLSCDYTQPGLELGGEPGCPSPSHGRREHLLLALK